MKQVQIEFEKITPTKAQTETLYVLFKQRLHKISAEAIDYKEHAKFVNSHPYRGWYLIKVDSSYAGSFYVSQENTIGLNLQEDLTQYIVEKVAIFVRENYKPLPPILSIRGGQFAINVPPTNAVLAKALESLDAQLIQKTYLLPSDQDNKRDQKD